MLSKTTGIVLHALKYGESGMIVHAYTKHFGRISLLVKGVRKSKSNFPSALLSPLSILNFDIYFKPSREIQIVKEITPVAPVPCHQENPMHTAIGMFLAELLYKVLREAEANPSLFQFLMNSLQYFTHMEEGLANFHLYFLVHLTRYLGFYPAGHFDEQHNYFDGITGTFVGNLFAPVTSMPMEESQLLSRLMYLPPEQLSSLKLTGIQRSRFLNEMLRYYQVHLEGMGNMKSLEVLKTVFHDV